jgi:hypothetical protein
LLRSGSLILLLATFSPAQTHGVPASVTSFGFGGDFNRAPGIPASVTSLGPNGFGTGFRHCCFGPFVRGNPPAFRNREHHAHDQDRFPVGWSMPVYVPYAVPYPVAYAEDETPDDDSIDADYNSSRGLPRPYDRSAWYREVASSSPATHDRTPKTPPREAAPSPAPEPDERAVAAQPNTVLIFKDGHKSEVQNYAIVGATLFDFSEGRSRKILLADLDLPATQKANDERGVDFQVPAKTAQANHKK